MMQSAEEHHVVPNEDAVLIPVSGQQLRTRLWIMSENIIPGTEEGISVTHKIHQHSHNELQT
jgi:hypothetical protein